MGWERGRYYTRSRKVNGRVVREYVGTGPAAAAAAQMDAERRERRRQEALDLQQVKADLDALDSTIGDLCEKIDLATRAALEAAGYHQHKRGEWRKRRGDLTQRERQEGPG
jgi:hypothetical protein